MWEVMVREGVIIGEGVILDARPASFMTRALAIAIDLLILFALNMAFAILFTSAPVSNSRWLYDFLSEYGQAFALIVVVTILVGIPTTVETLWRGQSVGKKALGIRVVRDDAGPVRFRHAFIRALVGVFELWMTAGSVAIITSLSNDKGKRLGDIAAGTYVIRVRGGKSTIAPVMMPHHLAAWAAHADMRQLPDGLALAARQYLGRVHKLNIESQQRVGQSLAAQMEQYVAPGPPPGTPAGLFLMAVLAERRNRDMATVARNRRVASEQAAMLHRLPYSIPDVE